jgi:hypothetical protein
MDRVPKRTKAEQETLFRFDEEEHVLWASTTTPRVAMRWRRAGYPLAVIGRYPDGAACSWEVELSWTGQKAPWVRVFRLGLSQWCPVSHQAHVNPHANEWSPHRGKGSGRVLRVEAPEGVGA